MKSINTGAAQENRKDKDFVIGRKPPKKLGFKEPYEKITKYENFITFSNGTGFLMLSQEKQGYRFSIPGTGS